MRVVVAGGTGVLGRRIAAALLDRGDEVVVLARAPQRAQALAARGATVVAADAFDRERLLAAVRDARSDAVLHQLTDLAARSSAANARVRIEGTRNLVDAAAAAGVRRFVVQSIAWAYEAGDAPADETTPLDVAAADEGRRATVDAIAVLERCAAELPDHVVLRNGLLYGPDTWYARAGDLGAAARSGGLPATADVTSFVHVDDAAAAAVAALDWPAGSVNVVDDEPAAGTDWVPAFCAAVGAPPPPTSPVPRQGWARGATNARARALGWAPTRPSWRTGFAG